MSAIRRSLLGAAESYPPSAPENRLTEIFAEVLRTSPQMIGWLVARAFGTESAMRNEVASYGAYEVDTQFSLGNGTERPDMQIRVGREDERVRRVFYVENKFGAAPTAAQLAGYPAADPDPVIVIVPDWQHWPGSSRFIIMTWSDVAREIHKRGREHERAHAQPWPDYAFAPDVPSEYRLLAELARYLEGLGVSTPRPLTAADLEILPRVLDTRERWDSLFRLLEAQLRVEPGLRAEHAEHFEGWGKLAWSLRLEASWPAITRYWEEQGTPTQRVVGSLVMAPQMSWAGAVKEEPSIGVGVSVDTETGWPTGLGEDQPYRLAAESAGFAFGTTWKGRVGRIFQTKRMLDFANDEITLDQQADEIVRWARDALLQVQDLEPRPTSDDRADG